MYALTDKIDIAGDWWDSEHPEATTFGQLSFARSRGIELRVNRAFKPLSGDVLPGDPNPTYQCVHGRTVKGEAVTLIDARQTGATLNFGSAGLMQPGIIRARVLVIGAHLSHNHRFQAMLFRIPNLQFWLGREVISQISVLDSKGSVISRDYSINFIEHEEFGVPAISSKISIHYGFESVSDAYSSMQLKVSAWLKIAPDDPQVMEWFLEQASKLEKLLSFLSGEVFVSDSIQSQIDQSNRVSTLFAGNEIQSPRRIWPKDFFLSRPSISAPFSAYCTKWFEVFTRIVAPATLAMSVMASEHLWIHIRFLSLFHVLEGFHRALYSGKYMEADAYNSVWKDIEGAIPGSVSGSHRSALVSRIKYGNEYSLRKRLGELEQSLTDEIRLHLFGPTKSIPVTWVNTRNYYTHWDDELKEKILDDQEMYYANVRIAHFLNTLFAILVGVPASDIESAFHGTSNAAQELIEINIIDRRAADPTFIPHAIMTISSGDNAGVGPAPFSNEEGST